MEQCEYTMTFFVMGIGNVPGRCEAEASASAEETVGFRTRSLKLCAAHVARYNATARLAQAGDDSGRAGSGTLHQAILPHTGRESGVRYGDDGSTVIERLPQADAGVCSGHPSGPSVGGFDCDCNCTVCWGRAIGTS